MKTIDVKIQWQGVLNREGSPYRYPEAASSFLRKRYPDPVVYRWRIVPAEDDGKERVYVGETEDIHQRIQRVRTPPKQGKGGVTNRKLKEYFDEQLSLGKEVVLEIADFEPFCFNAVQFAPSELFGEPKRCVIENLMICMEQAAGNRLLNGFENESLTKLKKKISRLSSPERRGAYEKIETLLKRLDEKTGDRS